MSINSRFKKDRLFQHQNKFSNGSDNYFESFYYLISSVEYDKDEQVVKVITNIILDVQPYLKLEKHRKVEDVFYKDIPQRILQNVKVWESLLD